MLQSSEINAVVVWHGGWRLPDTMTKGELLSRRASALTPLFDARVQWWALSRPWSVAYARKQLQASRRRAADPGRPVQYCGCGCGTPIPVATIIGRRPAVFVKGHSRMGAFVRLARQQRGAA